MTDTEHKFVSDIAFTPAVKAEQERLGSRAGYAKMEAGAGWRSTADEDLRGFIAARNSFYLATVNEEGHPYIQHRGGDTGFLKVLDDKTLAFADYSGNRQYITVGAMRHNPKAFIFLMDYPNRRRVKIWGRARFEEDDKALIRQVAGDTDSKVERVILFDIDAWDVNCPKYITPRYTEDELQPAIAAYEDRIRELTEENRRLHEQLNAAKATTSTNTPENPLVEEQR